MVDGFGGENSLFLELAESAVTRRIPDRQSNVSVSAEPYDKLLERLPSYSVLMQGCRALLRVPQSVARTY